MKKFIFLISILGSFIIGFTTSTIIDTYFPQLLHPTYTYYGKTNYVDALNSYKDYALNGEAVIGRVVVTQGSEIGKSIFSCEYIRFNGSNVYVKIIPIDPLMMNIVRINESEFIERFRDFNKSN